MNLPEDHPEEKLHGMHPGAGSALELPMDAAGCHPRKTGGIHPITPGSRLVIEAEQRFDTTADAQGETLAASINGRQAPSRRPAAHARLTFFSS
jgi:hypothetical protein